MKALEIKSRRLLGALGDQHVVGLGLDPVGADVLGDRLTQRPRSFGRKVLPRRMLPGDPLNDLVNLLHGKGSLIGEASGKRDHARERLKHLFEAGVVERCDSPGEKPGMHGRFTNFR